MHLHGGCHCGNIRFSLDWRGDPARIPARACGCSFCIKHGGVWTSHPGSALTVTIDDRTLASEYAFGTRTAAFHVCARCGAVPVVTSEIGARLYAVVNVNALENVERSALDRSDADFAGEDVDARRGRRTRNWIGDVRIVVAP